MNVLVTDAMLDAALKKAVEAGLLPRHACREDTKGYQDLIRYVLSAALEVAPARRRTIGKRFLEVRDRAHRVQAYAPT